jgi:hypothetical protein
MIQPFDFHRVRGRAHRRLPWLTIAFMCLVVVSRAGAQTPAPTIPPDSSRFLPRYNFHIAVAALSVDDPRFSWDAHAGGDLDLVDYVHGRLNVLADYEVELGNEFRPFDPNQGNYTLEASASVRVRGTEFAGVFHHVSRHLSDRPKEFSVDWNVVGARVLRRVAAGNWIVDMHAGAGAVVNHHYVDYRWIGDFNVLGRRRATRTVSVFASAGGKVVGVDGSVPERGTDLGARIEVGIRLIGDAAAIELFGGFERRVDAYPLDLAPRRWALAGFRLVSP